MEQEFAKDGTKLEWVLSLGSNKALEFLNGNAIDFGSTAGAAALLAKANGMPIKGVYIYSQAGMDRARRAQGLADQDGRGSEGQDHRRHARHRSAHLPAARLGGCTA